MRHKTLGCILIVAGTTIGAGMLALPLTMLSLGFPLSLLLLFAIWALMLITALTTLKVTLCFPLGSTFHTMARQVLGPIGWWVTTIAFMWLFYALLAAYTSGAAAFLSSYIPLSAEVLSLLFLGLFGGVIIWTTSAVDYTNRFLFALKIIAFLVISVALSSQVKPSALLESASPFSVSFWISLPLLVTSFGFHGSIPSLVKYMGKDSSRLKFIFIIGSFIPVILYIIWLGLIFGSIGSEPLTSMSVGELTTLLKTKTGLAWIGLALDIFAQLAIVTSFLGVGLGLRSFFSDMLQRSKEASRVAVALITFLPPTFIVLLFPSIFIQALGFAAIALLILAVFIPILLAFRMPKKQLSFSPKARWGLAACFLMGVGLVGIEILNIASVLR